MRRRREAQLARALREIRIPDELGAQHRAWPVVRGAFAARLAVSRRRSRLRFVPAPAILVLVAGALELTPAGAAVHRLIDRALSGPRVVSVYQVSLPAPGSLLVSSSGGTWVVGEHGQHHRLGPWTVASWSPHGLYAAVTRGDELAAVDPDGRLAWQVPALAPSDPRWSVPSGYRISYLSGRTLRVLTGDARPLDGVGPVDWALAGGVAPVAPAWRPEPTWRRGHAPREELVYATARGSIVEVDADSRQELWRTRLAGSPGLLSFSADGRRLLVLTAAGAAILDARGRVLRTIRGSFEDGALSPNGRLLALLSGRTVLLAEPSARPLPVFTARGGGLAQLAWSPEGSWLLASWPRADEWVFIHATGAPSDQIEARVGQQFGGHFPRIDGWCCTIGGGAS